MTSRFAAPSESNGIDMDATNGHLLVIKVLGHESGITTVYGEKDAIRATVHDISAQTTTEDTLLFGGYLIGALKNRVGQEVLAVLYQGAASRPGQNPPWMLTKDAAENPQYIAAATAYLDAYEAKRFQAPAAAAAPAAPVAPVVPVAAPVAPVAPLAPVAAPVAPMPADHLMAPAPAANPLAAAFASIPGLTPEQQAAIALLQPQQ
jgi:hypothetical protein